MKRQTIAWLLLCAMLLSGCAAPAAPAETAPASPTAREPVPAAPSPDSAPEASAETETAPVPERVILGDEQFDRYLPLLEGKRTAIYTNHSGIVGNVCSVDYLQNELLPFGLDSEGQPAVYGEHILDALLRQGVEVTAVFSPEHGFRGTEDAGAAVGDSADEATGVPVISLYGGATPDREKAALFDVLVIDLQDLGVRFYTYYLTMLELLDLCAREGKNVVLLDRPNPNGFRVDGPVLRPEFRSGVGSLPLPVLYGMTWGELARMIDGEGWLSTGPDSLDLTVIPCLNYDHGTRTAPVVRPSPNIRDLRAVYLYPSVCFFENSLISVGRGTEHPFECYGSPLLEGFDYSFVPQSLPGAQFPPFEGLECRGEDLRLLDPERAQGPEICLDWLIGAYRSVRAADPEAAFFGAPDASGHYWIDLLFGTDSVRRMIESGADAGEIRASWQQELEEFKALRAFYLLYEDGECV